MIPLLSIRHASKAYNGIPALIDASLELQAGEVHALMGENGAGKSTLIRLLAGATPPDSFEVYLNGEPLHITDPHRAYDYGLRFIHQELNVVPQLSVAENIYISAQYPSVGGLLVNWQRLNQAAKAALGRLGIHHIKVRAKMVHLAPGDQMLVKIAAALVDRGGAPAKVYVMDEPTAGLSGQETEQLFGVIRRLQAEGAAILYVSHRMDEIFRICDRVTVMRDGRVVATRPINETNPPEVIHLMTGRDLQHVYPPRAAPLRDDLLLSVRDLTTSKIRGVNFDLRAGEILGVAGLNGSGRTELLRALMGIDRLLDGELRLLGRLLRHRTPSGAWRSGLAFVPEERRSQGLILSQAIRSNVSLPHLDMLSTAGIFTNAARERRVTHELGGAVRLKARSAQQITRELSGGNQQKVVFARGLARQPRLLLLDEPTRGVDVGAKYDIYTLIREASAKGIGVIMVSSELAELIGLCDRIAIMHHGQLVDLVSVAGLSEQKLLSLCYGEEQTKVK